MEKNPFRRRAILIAIAASMLASTWALISMSYPTKFSLWPNIGESRRYLFELARGLCLVQPYLLAAWAALGPEHFATRVGRSTLMLVVLWTAPVWWRPGPWTGVPPTYWIQLATIGFQFLLAAVLLMSLRIARGWRIVPLETWHQRPEERGEVFSLREFFIQILGFAMVLTYMRAFAAFGLYLPDGKRVLMGLLQDSIRTALLAPAAALCIGLVLAVSKWRGYFRGVMMVLAVLLMLRVYAVSVTGNWNLPLTEFLFLAATVAYLLLIRVAGFRLWRKCDLSTVLAISNESSPVPIPSALDGQS